MSIKRKLNTALKVLKTGGVKALLETSARVFKSSLGPYKPNESQIAFDALKGASFQGVMLDVGAHFGSSLELFAQQNWKVFAFEPDSKNRIKLEAEYKNRDNVVIDSRAVSDQAQSGVTLFRSDVSTGISGLSSFHDSHKEGEKVDVVTLKQYLSDNKIAANEVDFLKIDTEGFDLNVLKGFPWESASPRMILCEFEDAKTQPLGYNFDDLAGFLLEHGYKLVVSEWYPVQQYGGNHQWRRFVTYPCKLQDAKAWGNIIAVKEDALYRDLLKLCKLH